MVQASIKRIEEIVKSMGIGDEQFKFTHEPGISSYLGVQVEQSKDSKVFELKQPFLIDRILKTMDITGDFNDRMSPTIKPQLHKDDNGSERKCQWN